MATSYEPYGYKEMNFTQKGRYEYIVRRLLEPLVREKNQTFSDSEIKFLSVFIYLFKNKIVRTNDLFVKMFSHPRTNYQCLDKFLHVGIVQKVERGHYKLQDKVQTLIDKIQREVP